MADPKQDRREAAADFTAFGLIEPLQRALDGLGFTKPTPVQADALPFALAGRDVLACASTGSGKTAAFVLPMLQRLQNLKRGTTRALVLVPTRELAMQVVEHVDQLATHVPVRAAAIYGGVGMLAQEQAFRRGVDILVATPGRLLDHMQYDYAALAGIEMLVLDEADRMLDMGFLPAIRRVLQHLPKRERQTLFFSATMPPAIGGLARELLVRPATVNLERKAAPAEGITQALYPVPGALKVDLLVELLRRDEIGNAIVFCRTKHRANRVAEKLNRAGILCERIHGNRSQAQRTKALAGFKDGTFRVLVATDVVARGIDVTALEHVVNFDVPAAAEDYIHRVGRTARADATGDAYTFVAPEEETELRDIERRLGGRIARRTVSGFDYSARAERLEVPIQERLAAARAARQGRRPKQPAGAASGSRNRRPTDDARSARDRPTSRNQDAPRTRAESPDGQQKPDGRRRRRRGGRGR
ncbi:MAG: DEAD/DEAH box helicase, partial [Longimicrobiales bacterium]